MRWWRGFEEGRPRSAAPTAFYLAISLLLLSACKSANEKAATNTAASDTVVSSTPPFKTKEPDRYQATRIVTVVTADGKTRVTKSLVARDGDSRRHESEMLSKRVAYLDLPEGTFVLLLDERVYAEVTSETESEINQDEEITPEHLLHDDASTTSYQNLGKEVVAGRNSNKYKSVVNSSGPGNVSHNETLIWIDETLNMPIRSETTAADGTRITMELSNVSLDVDKRLFQLPNDYEKIAFSELRKRLTATE